MTNEAGLSNDLETENNPWIENTGLMPVDVDTLVDVRFRDEWIRPNLMAGAFRWNILGSNSIGDIIQWRLHIPEKRTIDTRPFKVGEKVQIRTPYVCTVRMTQALAEAFRAAVDAGDAPEPSPRTTGESQVQSDTMNQHAAPEEAQDVGVDLHKIASEIALEFCGRSCPVRMYRWDLENKILSALQAVEAKTMRLEERHDALVKALRKLSLRADHQQLSIITEALAQAEKVRV